METLTSLTKLIKMRQMPNYLTFNSNITLEQAIQELRQREEQQNNISIKMLSKISPTFEQHDAVHILFACGTTIEDEIAVHIWMLFGTTAKFDEMHQIVANQEHGNIISNIGHLKLIRIWISCFPRILNIIIKCSRMKKRLALEELEKLKKQSLCEIRCQYGIVV
jgi:hypothetical protein